MRTISRLVLLCTWAMLGLLCYRAGAVPDSSPVPLADPSGVWLAFVGSDPQPRYRVHIGRDADGVLITRWATLGNDPRLHYAGKLAAVNGEWVETYDDSPNLMRCSPWHWRIANERPLAFCDMDIVAGWTLTRDKGDI